jgi:hypothetical protein
VSVSVGKEKTLLVTTNHMMVKEVKGQLITCSAIDLRIDDTLVTTTGKARIVALEL